MWPCLNNLAQLLQATNRLAEAEPLMRRAREILADSLGPDHPSTKTVRENLEALLAEIEGAMAQAAEGPLTPALSPRGEGDPVSPQSGHPLPQARPGELASRARPHSQANAEGEREAPPRRGLLARMFGRR